MKVVVTGATGFIGRHATYAFAHHGYDVVGLDVTAREEDWVNAIAEADAIIHLAGANRPPRESDFERINVDLTKHLIELVTEAGTRPTILFSSSAHVGANTAYGRTKLAAEHVLEAWATEHHGKAVIFRLHNIFGKWSRPNYNSVVATWCHRISRGLRYEITDPQRIVTLTHVDDVLGAFLTEIETPVAGGTARRCDTFPNTTLTLGELRDRLEAIAALRQNGMLIDLGDPFNRKLLGTYLSFLPGDAFAYDLDQKSDVRGTLAEFIKSEHAGQVFVSRTKPGITRGEHFHHTKVEKFLVLEGEAAVSFRNLVTNERQEYRVTGRDFRVVDVPPGWTHNIANTGSGELVVLFWASEPFDATKPDTYAELVNVSHVNQPAARQPHER